MTRKFECLCRPIFANDNIILHLSNVISAQQLIAEFFTSEGFILITVGFIKITDNECEHLFESGDYVELPVQFDYKNVQIDKVTDILWLTKSKLEPKCLDKQ